MRGAIIVLAALAFAACGGSGSGSPAKPAPPASTPVADITSPRHARPHARNTCRRQSGADFPGAFTSPDNFVHGPLVLVGGNYTPPETVHEYGGNKFPLLVRVGHTVTITVAREARRFARLAYGPLPQGETHLRDAYVSASFFPCRPGRSWSSADGEEVTFWSGFVLSRRPVCLPLDISVDRGPAERVGFALGARC